MIEDEHFENSTEDKTKTPDVQYGEATFVDGSKPTFSNTSRPKPPVPPKPEQSGDRFRADIITLIGGILSLSCCFGVLGVPTIAFGCWALFNKRRKGNKIITIIGILMGLVGFIMWIAIAVIKAQNPDWTLMPIN